MREIIKNYWRWLMWSVLAIAGYILFLQLIQQWQDFDSSLLQFRWHYTGLSLVGFISVILWWGVVWYQLIPPSERTKMTLNQLASIHIWSWIARYIPGKVTSIVGKIALAQRYGIPKRTLVIAGMYEQILQISTALVVGIVLSLSAWSLALSIQVALTVIGVMVVALAIFCHPRVFHFLANSALRVFRRDRLQPESVLSYPKLLYIALLYTLGHLVNGVSFFVLTKSLYPVENITVVPLTGFYLLAGVIGMLAIIVPSGLGVREGVLIGLLTQFVSFPIATAIAIMARLVSTVADGVLGLGLFVGRLIQRYKWEVLVWIVAIGVAVFVVWMPFLWSSSYIDEYWHIFAGRDVWQAGELASLYSTGPYDRGMVISRISGLLQTLFGEVYWIQKSIPVGFSLLTLGGMWLLARRVWRRNPLLVSMTILLWALNPWLLFNHQYIRMYIWYEFLLVWGVLLGVILHNQPLRSWVLGTLSVQFVLWVGFFMANDPSYLFIPLGVSCVQIISFVARTELFGIPHWKRVMGVLGLATLIVLSPWGRQTLAKLLTQDFIYATEETYWEFFTQRNGIVSLFFMAGWIIWVVKGTFYQRIIAWTTGILLGFHFVSSADVQLIRSILYLLPLVYLISLAPISLIMKIPRKMIRYPLVGMMIGVLAWGVYQTYPLDEGYVGEKHLMLPGEINAIEYQHAYQWVEENCQGVHIFETSPTPFIAEWYGVSLDGVVITEKDWLETDTIFEPTEAGYQVYYNQVPVVSSTDAFPKEFCWIQRTPSLGNYLSSETQTVEAEITDFLGIRVLKRIE